MSNLGDRASILAEGAKVELPYNLARGISSALRPVFSDWEEFRNAHEDFKHDPFGTIIEWDDRSLLAKFPQLRAAVERILDYAEAKTKLTAEAFLSSADVLEDINRIISERTRYGVRSEVAQERSIILAWSNALANWHIAHGYGVIPRGKAIELDANYILVPYSMKQVEPLLEYLQQLPLYAYSFEARRGREERFEGAPPNLPDILRQLDRHSGLIPPGKLIQFMTSLIGKAPPGLVGAIGLQLTASPTYERLRDVVEAQYSAYPPIAAAALKATE